MNRSPWLSAALQETTRYREGFCASDGKGAQRPEASSPWEPEELERLVQESMPAEGARHPQVQRRQKNLEDMRTAWWGNQRILRSRGQGARAGPRSRSLAREGLPFTGEQLSLTHTHCRWGG